MTDTNGRVAAEHLVPFAGVPVSKAIYPKMVATSLDFHRSGYTFTLVAPGGGARDWAMQGAMQAAYDAKQFGVAPFYLSRPPSPRPADQGHSRHGFGLSVDVATNAPHRVMVEIMARNGWTLWTASDYDHFEPNEFNVLVAPPESAFASNDVTPLPPITPPEEDDMITVQYAPWAGWKFVLALGFIKNAPGTEADTLAAATNGQIHPVSLEQMTDLIYAVGLREFIPGGQVDVEPLLRSLAGGLQKTATFRA